MTHTRFMTTQRNCSHTEYAADLGSRYKGKFKCNANSLNAMQEGRGKPHTAPKVFPRPSRTHPTPFLFPSTVPTEEKLNERGLAIAFSFFLSWTVRGSGKRVEGVRGRREKNLGALWVVSRLPRIAFEFGFKSTSQQGNKPQRGSESKLKENQANMTFHRTQLSNGLQIIAEGNPDAHSFAAGFYVNTGSRDESPEINGVSHFLEHMMFKGSSKYTWEDVNRIFDEMGANYNAYTSQENTAYFANVLPEFTERAIEHLSHLLRPAIRRRGFRDGKESHPGRDRDVSGRSGPSDLRSADGAHFAKHPLSMSVLGTADTIRKLERGADGGIFPARIRAGEHDPGGVGQAGFRADRGDRPRNTAAIGTEIAVAAEAAGDRCSGRGGKTMVDAKLNRQYTMAMTPGPSAQDERRFAARVLADVIGDAEGSRFYWALVDNAIAEEADFGFYPHDGCGSFYISLTTDPKRADEALKIARKELERVKTDLGECRSRAGQEQDRQRHRARGRSPHGPPAGHRRAMALQQGIPFA